MYKVLLNKAQCRKCKDIITSKYGHDFKQCKCKAIFVDGGKNYVRRGASDFADIIEKSEYVKCNKCETLITWKQPENDYSRKGYWFCEKCKVIYEPTK